MGRREGQQARRDIGRAEVLLGELRGVTVGEAAETLRLHASVLGVSVHAAALAVLAGGRALRAGPAREHADS